MPGLVQVEQSPRLSSQNGPRGTWNAWRTSRLLYTSMPECFHDGLSGVCRACGQQCGDPGGVSLRERRKLCAHGRSHLQAFSECLP